MDGNLSYAIKSIEEAMKMNECAILEEDKKYLQLLLESTYNLT